MGIIIRYHYYKDRIHILTNFYFFVYSKIFSTDFFIRGGLSLTYHVDRLGSHGMKITIMAHHFGEYLSDFFQASYYANPCNPLTYLLYNFHGHTWYLKIEKMQFLFSGKGGFVELGANASYQGLLKIGNTCHLVKL